MKRLFIALALMASTIFTTSYAAGNNNASPLVMQAFQSTFHNAKNVSWEKVGVLNKATFTVGDQYHSAFFNNDGDLIAQTQNLLSTKLPKSLQASLKKEIAGRWVTDLFVVSIEGHDTYYVTLENADTKVMLKSAGAKKWSVYQKNDK
jgi:hypothetical protein